MRNLKRVLSLTLASVMLLGMMVIGSSAAEAKKINFTDAGEIEYNEAVDVMVALGVLEGNPNGDFNPQGTLTREQAAKIISCMLLGPENAEKLTNNTVIFSDVAAGRWSAGYIAYCAQQGILAGTGNGAFNPTGELTGAAFGKMLLVALGYDPSIQIYTGSSWAISVASDMLDAGIDVSGTVLSAPLTREQAAQMAFQTLEADIVDYANRGTVVDLGNGQSVSINASKPEPVRATGSQNYNEAADDSHDEVYQQFCEKYFTKLLKKNLAEGDELGRPGYAWEVDGAEVSTYAEGAKYVLKDEFTGKDLYNTVGKTAASDDYTWTVYQNGADDDIDADDMQGYAQDKSTADAAKYGGNGTVTEIYVDTDAETVTVCIIDTFAAKVDKVYTEDDVDDDENPYVTVDGMDFETVAFEEDDVVLYTKGLDDQDSDVIVTMTLADSVEGEVTKVTTGKNFTVDGTSYKYNRTLADGDKITTGSVDKDVLFYVDNSGYMVFKGEAKSSNDYAVVIGAGLETNRYDSSKKTCYAQLLLTDGTVVSVELDNVPDANKGDESDLRDAYVGHIVSYTVDNDKYELTVKSETKAETKTVIDIVSGKATIVAGASATDTVRVNNDTVFLVCNDKDDEDYSVYVGYKNVPNISKTDSSTLIAYYAEAGKPAKVVYVEGATVESDGTDDVIFIRANKNAEVIKESGKEYREFDAIVDGKKTEIQVANSALTDASNTNCKALIADANNGKIYAAKSLSYNSKDLVTKITLYEAATSSNTGVLEATGTTKVDAGVVGFGDKTYNWSDEVVVAKYDDDAKTKMSVSSISSIKTDTNDEVVLVVEKEKTVIGVFITVVPGSPEPCDHSTRSHVAADAATCTEDGNIEYWTCDCGKYWDAATNGNELVAADLVDEATGHQNRTSAVAVKGSDCQHDGTKAHWTCNDCGAKLQSDSATAEIATDDWLADSSNKGDHRYGTWTEVTAGNVSEFDGATAGQHAHKCTVTGCGNVEAHNNGDNSTDCTLGSCTGS